MGSSFPRHGARIRTKTQSREPFETLNCKHKIWAEHAMILDEIDLAIRANFESRG